jgi:hypothetical protein
MKISPLSSAISNIGRIPPNSILVINTFSSNSILATALYASKDQIIKILSEPVELAIYP